ncbi:uncharacterized protein LTR77_004741 [Saxophila tyrrhenica]|uniref:Uncharacterized protein n=1 Tax=Saxophila tyrrhenica TaxID=1690608 RepID=A0AAV9PAE9_9PEZI|nr:hypothetical protein LTR77_004741 [Saxophila tyrrhenica]
MAAPRKTIISSGLGQYAGSDANALKHFGADAQSKVKAMLAESIQKANDAGFDVIAVDANPQDPEDTMKRFTEALKSHEAVGFNVGFGLRGHKEHTELFEKLVNNAVQARPGIKIMFSNGPGEVITAIRRNFPEDF